MITFVQKYKSFFRKLFSLKIILFFLTLVAGIIIYLPGNNRLEILAQSDHGLNLYAFEQTMRGKTPYQDFWWCYGPLMPYVYALFFKLLGPTIQAALLVNNILEITISLLIFLTLAQYANVALAFAAGLWFLIIDSPHLSAFNHTGGLAALASILYFLVKYIMTEKRCFILGALAAVFALFLIKLNFGLLSYIGIMLCLAGYDLVQGHLSKNVRIYFYGTFVLFVSIMAIHLFFIHGLPDYYISQCFPLSRSYDQFNQGNLPFLSSLTTTLTKLLKEFLSRPLALLCLICLLFVFSKKKGLPPAKKQPTKNLFLLGATALFLVISAHEFLLRDMSYTRWWIRPFYVIFFFTAVAFIFDLASKAGRVLVLIALGLTLLLQGYNRWVNESSKLFFPFKTEKSDIYIANSPAWIHTVFQTIHFLKKNLKENENFFALPAEPLYYYLTNHESPTKELWLADYLHFTPMQEIEMIRCLETKNVNYVLISNRFVAIEPGCGTFGVSYCPLLARYIASRFKTVAIFGTWDKVPFWYNNHGMQILKRIN